VTNYLDWSPEIRVCADPPGRRLSCLPSMYKGEPNILYHNNGDGTFSDVSGCATGIAKCIGKGMGVAIADYDGNGWTDIFVANDNERNFLFKNRHGQGFDEVGVESFVVRTRTNGVPVSRLWGVDFRDWSNTGRPGLFVTALGVAKRSLFFATRTEDFSQWLRTSPGIGFASSQDERVGCGNL